MVIFKSTLICHCFLPEVLAVGTGWTGSLSALLWGQGVASFWMGEQGRRVAVRCVCISSSVEGFLWCKSVLYGIRAIYLSVTHRFRQCWLRDVLWTAWTPGRPSSSYLHCMHGQFYVQGMWLHWQNVVLDPSKIHSKLDPRSSLFALH